MAQQWQELGSKFNGLSQRERVLVAAATLILLGFIAFLPLESIWNEQSKLTKQVQGLQQESNILEQQIALYQQRLTLDPDADYQQRLTLLNQQMADVDAELALQMVDMVPADYMPTVLAQLLSKGKGIKLLSFASIPPVALLQVGEEDKMNLYSHGIKLTIEGDYFSVLNFVQAVETMPDKLYWKRLDYQVIQHPKASVELELYTLSINKDFISVAKQD
ncbi:MSHA biogenesis protein MshJ [Shewanella aestuarii]|uniref:MSHA biogenesis protein MshJ n=1 Tax=Shewanella aestuarii TaxID=1028752 RepID=A0A6G9QFR0_9GAMM|nr:MSHA biogenesis protein MshJ [Shewanella aestuarii]QIR13360.1 MSHA biogenesis protein MshJ [Shewanella aestuarii]